MRPRLELNPVSHNEAKLYLIPSKFTSNIFTALFKLVNAEVAFEFPLATVCIIFKALVVVLALNLVAWNRTNYREPARIRTANMQVSGQRTCRYQDSEHTGIRTVNMQVSGQ